MAAITEPGRFITDDAGNKVGVILGLARYEELLAAKEELDDLRAFDDAKASDGEAIAFEQAVEEIERARR